MRQVNYRTSNLEVTTLFKGLHY